MYLAIDIGATKTLIALFSERGRIKKSLRFLTSHDQYTFTADLSAALRNFASCRVSSVVIAVPGVVASTSSITFGNLPWQNFDFNPLLTPFFPCTLHILNDADLATFYEASFHPGLTCYLTFSTGIGGGLARDGILTADSPTFEPGHKIYSISGTPVEWEDFAAASAIRSAYGISSVTDLKDKNFMQDIAARLTLGLVDIIRTYRPTTIIIGGPLALIFRRLKKPLLASLTAALPGQPLPSIVPAKKPTESVIYGCYLYAKTH